MSHAGIHQFFKFDPGRHTIRILDDRSAGIHPHFFIDKDRLAEKERLNFDYGKLESRFYLPIIDLNDQKSKMLSISKAGRKALDTVIEQYLAALESDRLLRAQAEAARHFKRSKLFYGAKR